MFFRLIAACPLRRAPWRLLTLPDRERRCAAGGAGAAAGGALALWHSESSRDGRFPHISTPVSTSGSRVYERGALIGLSVPARSLSPRRHGRRRGRARAGPRVQLRDVDAADAVLLVEAHAARVGDHLCAARAARAPSPAARRRGDSPRHPRRGPADSVISIAITLFNKAVLTSYGARSSPRARASPPRRARPLSRPAPPPSPRRLFVHDADSAAGALHRRLPRGHAACGLH